MVPGITGDKPLPNPVASRCHGLLIRSRRLASSMGARLRVEMIEPSPVQLYRLIVAIIADAFRQRANLADTGVVGPEVAQRHFQRAAVDPAR